MAKLEVYPSEKPGRCACGDDRWLYREKRTTIWRCWPCLRQRAIELLGAVARDPRFEITVDECGAGHKLPYGKRGRKDCPVCIRVRKRLSRALGPIRRARANQSEAA